MAQEPSPPSALLACSALILIVSKPTGFDATTRSGQRLHACDQRRFWWLEWFTTFWFLPPRYLRERRPLGGGLNLLSSNPRSLDIESTSCKSNRPARLLFGRQCWCCPFHAGNWRYMVAMKSPYYGDFQHPFAAWASVCGPSKYTMHPQRTGVL
jgi:hypothetical protein